MSAFFAATVYAWISHSLAWVLLPKSVAWGAGVRALVLWAVAAAALFLLRDPMATMLVTGCVILLLVPLGLTQRAAFFLIAVPCLPVYLTAPVPFPGLEHLIALTHHKIAVLIVLLPMFLYSTSKYPIARTECHIFSGAGHQHLSCPICSASGRASAIPQTTPSRAASVAGISLCFYVVYTAIIVTGASNPTGGLRFLVDQTILLAIPFFAIRLAIKTLDDVDTFLKAFLIASVFLAAVALIASLKRWDFYWMLQPPSALTIPDLRGGFVRINATASTHSLGFHCAAGLVVLQYFSTRMSIGWIKLNVARFVLLTGIYFTDSRGAMGGLAVAAIVYAMITVESRVWLLVLAGLVSLGGVVGSIWLLTAEFPNEGRLGSFSYRQELLRISIPHILAHPLFGDYMFYRNKSFEVLIQGQGIIDITNLYLQVALHYGLIGLGLFFTILLAPLSVLTGRALRRAERAPAREVKNTEEDAASPEWRGAAGVVVGILAGWLFLVATTSDVGLTVHIGVVLAAMAQGLCDLSKARVVGPSANAWATPRLGPSNLPARGSISSRTTLLVERSDP